MPTNCKTFLPELPDWIPICNSAIVQQTEVKFKEALMRKFYHTVDKRSRKAMIKYLKGHYRYNTANSWNGSSSYAHNMKFHSLGLDSETRSKLYELSLCDGFYETIRDLIHEFSCEHNWQWQAGFNGRSGGYLVLYQGERVPSGYKSFCPKCGQLNGTSVSENSGMCGVCKHERRDFTTTHMVVNIFTGRGTDEYEDFEDWEMYHLRERVELIQSFDKLADAILAEAVFLAGEYEAGEEEYTVVKTRPVMLSKKAV